MASSKVWVEVEADAEAGGKGTSSDGVPTPEDRLLAWLKLDPQRREKALYSHENQALQKITMELRFEQDVSDETLIRFIKAVLTGSLMHGSETRSNLHLLFLAIFKRVQERPLSAKLASFLIDDYISQAIIYALADDGHARRDMHMHMCILQTRLREQNEEDDGDGDDNNDDDDDVMPALDSANDSDGDDDEPAL